MATFDAPNRESVPSAACARIHRAHVVTAMRARELGRRAVAVGDLVDLVGDTDGAPDTLARIVRIAPGAASAAVRRRHRPVAERVLVANADQLVIVCALADPLPRTGFIDRCLVAAYTGNLDAGAGADQGGPGRSRHRWS